MLLVLRTYPREVLIAMGARMAENVSYYIFTIVSSRRTSTTQLGLGKSIALNAVLIGAAVHFVTIPMWGALSDRIGRRPVYLVGAVGVGVWAFAFFALLDTKSFAARCHRGHRRPDVPRRDVRPAGGLLLRAVRHEGPLHRASRSATSSPRSSPAALAPIIAVKLLKTYGSGTPIAVYVAICAVISVVAVLSYRETRDRDLATVTKGESV